LHGAKAGGTTWHFLPPAERLSVPVNFWSVSDTNLSLVLAACSGLGFVYLPRVTIASELRQGKLQSVLPDFCRGIDWGIFAVHVGRVPTKNAAALIEFVRDAVATFDGVHVPWSLACQTGSGSGAETIHRDRRGPAEELRVAGEL